MAIVSPFNLKQWIDDNRHLLKPPVGNACIYQNTGDFIVMVVGGPNNRKDFHFNQTEELFIQLEGDINVRIQEDNQVKDIQIKAGDIFLLPAGVPHSPQRGANTVGLVIERVRGGADQDAFMWFCENCNEKLYEKYLPITDIVTQLPPVMNAFYADNEKCKCKKCGHIMEAPTQKS